MNVKKEFDEITESLKQQRGDIQLQIHLANMEAKQEWKKVEKNWDKFVDSIGVITDETKETSTEIILARHYSLFGFRDVRVPECKK